MPLYRWALPNFIIELTWQTQDPQYWQVMLVLQEVNKYHTKADLYEGIRDTKYNVAVWMSYTEIPDHWRI